MQKPEPKSSPSLVRSDTYVRENNSEDPSNDDSFRKNVLPQLAIHGFSSDDFSIANLNVPEFRKKLNILREVATEVVRKIDDLEASFFLLRTTKKIYKKNTKLAKIMIFPVQ